MVRKGFFPWPRSSLRKIVRRHVGHDVGEPGSQSRRRLDPRPEIVLFAIDPNENFVQVPAVAQATLMPLQISGVTRTELSIPHSNRFIGDDDSAFGEKIFDISKGQTEAMVDPDRVADDF